MIQQQGFFMVNLQIQILNNDYGIPGTNKYSETRAVQREMLHLANTINYGSNL